MTKKWNFLKTMPKQIYNKAESATPMPKTTTFTGQVNNPGS